MHGMSCHSVRYLKHLDHHSNFCSELLEVISCQKGCFRYYKVFYNILLTNFVRCGYLGLQSNMCRENGAATYRLERMIS